MTATPKNYSDMVRTSAEIMPEVQREVELFLFAEGELLDERNFPAWLHLYTRDCVYWIPAGAEKQDPTRKVSIVYDRWQTLAERVWRFEGGLAYSQEPKSTTSHLIGNVVVSDVESGGHKLGDVINVTSRFIVTEHRNDVDTVHSGRNTHRLVRTQEGLRILEKKVELISRGGHLGNLGLPL